jgi:hypothetical protein
MKFATLSAKLPSRLEPGMSLLTTAKEGCVSLLVTREVFVELLELLELLGPLGLLGLLKAREPLNDWGGVPFMLKIPTPEG